MWLTIRSMSSDVRSSLVPGPTAGQSWTWPTSPTRQYWTSTRATESGTCWKFHVCVTRWVQPSGNQWEEYNYIILACQGLPKLKRSQLNNCEPAPLLTKLRKEHSHYSTGWRLRIRNVSTYVPDRFDLVMQCIHTILCSRTGNELKVVVDDMVGRFG